MNGTIVPGRRGSVLRKDGIGTTAWPPRAALVPPLIKTRRGRQRQVPGTTAAAITVVARHVWRGESHGTYTKNRTRRDFGAIFGRHESSREKKTPTFPVAIMGDLRRVDALAVFLLGGFLGDR